MIRIDRDGAVRTVTMDRADKRYALNPAMMAAVTEAFKVSPEPEERVTVLRGAGPSVPGWN